METMVHKQLYEYGTISGILYEGQSGFRKHQCTYTALLTTICKRYNEIDNGNYVGVLFIDLSNAFDMVNHDWLVEKLHTLKIQNKEHCWFKSYLTTYSMYFHQ